MDSTKAEKVLAALEATEANLLKLERIWSVMSTKIPEGISFDFDLQYDDLRRHFAEIVQAMPSVDGFKLQDSTLDLTSIAQWRFDAREVDEVEAIVAAEEAIQQPARDIAEYKFRLQKKRRQLVRELVLEHVEAFDRSLMALLAARSSHARDSSSAPEAEVEELRMLVSGLDRLLGSITSRPPRWGDLKRHLGFGLWLDIVDVDRLDWPTVRPGIVQGLYGVNDPLPVPVSDLDSLEELPPHTPVPTALAFDTLKANDFERLLFALVSTEPGYANPQWLMHTNAPDRGRDISVERVIADGLGGTRRERVIIQCKHWRGSSVGVAELATLKEQARLWDTPRATVLVIATTGRFSADAVLAIEKHNEEGTQPRIEMWPDSHLELVLSRRPAIVAEFGLRGSAPAP